MIRNKGVFKQYVALIVLFIISEVSFSQGNIAPIAVRDVATIDINTQLDVPSGAPDNYQGLLENDYDTDGNDDDLIVTRFSVDGGITWIDVIGSGTTAIAIFSGTVTGEITIFPDGTYTFVPANNYTGYVPDIYYEISDGTDVSTGVLLLTVETDADIIKIKSIGSCNQGYTTDGKYKIRYEIVVENISITRGYHQNSEGKYIQLINDLESVFGDTCIDEIQRIIIGVNPVNDFISGYYPIEFDPLSWNASFSEDDDAPGTDGIFREQVVNNSILYPRQKIGITYCVMVDPDCNNRPFPAPVGSGIDFENVVTLTSSRGGGLKKLKITDFHTPETTVSANLYINDELANGIYAPVVQPDATFVYSHKVIITNDGNSMAKNVNFNLGLKNFTDEDVDFVYTTVSQVANGGPSVAVNPNYNGHNKSLLLLSGNNLNAGESIILKIDFKVNPLQSINKNLLYKQLITSMTYGIEDGQGDPPVFENETVYPNNQVFSYVIWSDSSMGYHLDRYYLTLDDTAIPSSDNQCKCDLSGVRLFYNLRAVLNKTSTVIDEAPGGIEEFQEVTFEITFTNTTLVLELIKIQIQDDLASICGGNHIVSVSEPQITESTATQDPIINTGFNGVTDINIFDGNSGILLAEDPGIVDAEYFKVKFNVIFVEDCDGENTLAFSAWDNAERNELIGLNSYIDTNNNSITPAYVNLSSDYDNDGVTNVNDLDDDNDGIPDLHEYGGLDPLDDSDGDLIPNYQDTTAINDVNGDGIVDVFDFDMDGIPNHFDLDSDNDGIFDIVEAGNGTLDTSSNGTTNNEVGLNGLDDTVEVVIDDIIANVNYVLMNSDLDTHFNFLDIDSDNDGIVDNIEAQLTNAYVLPNTPNLLGLVYTDGLIPIDTDEDTIPDYLDTDSDNDTRADSIEGWDFGNDGIADTIALNNDADNDGLDDAYDINSLIANPLNNATNTQIPTDFPNVDNPFTDEGDWREIPAIVVLISNESEIEGNDLNFTISLVSLNSYVDNTFVPKASITPIVLDLFTGEDDSASQYGKATENFDYLPIIQSNTEITIPIGDTTFNFTIHNGDNVIQTFDDTINELNETFILNGLVKTENIINPVTNEIEVNVAIKGTGTILDDDDAPDLIMNDDIKDEGELLIHTVSINPTVANPTTASSRPIEIEIVVTDQTAIHPEDYTNTSPDTVIIAATVDPNNENTFIDYTIETILDGIKELKFETVSVVGEVTSGVVGIVDLKKTGTIVDNEPPPKLIISNSTVIEGEILNFSINLVNPNTNEPLANYQDINLNIFTTNGTAREPGDYTAISTQIIIPALTTSTKVQVLTNDDKLVEEIEDLVLKGIVTTSNTDNDDAEGLGTIIDNDLPNLFSPNGDGYSDVFEVVHLLEYLDFKLQIFDRWGSEVYNYDNNGNPSPIWWNGTMNGTPVPEGVYYYTIDYNNSKTKPISGFIQLIR